LIQQPIEACEGTWLFREQLDERAPHQGARSDGPRGRACEACRDDGAGPQVQRDPILPASLALAGLFVKTDVVHIDFQRQVATLIIRHQQNALARRGRLLQNPRHRDGIESLGIENVLFLAFDELTQVCIHDRHLRTRHYGFSVLLRQRAGQRRFASRDYEEAA
jgi:hypothetical protein